MGKGTTISADYRAVYRDHGILASDGLRYFRAVKALPDNPDRGRDGYILTETELPEDCYVMIGRLKKAIEDREFGPIDAGSIQLSYFPDQIPAKRYDQFIVPGITFRASHTGERDGDLCALPHEPVTELISVYGADGDYTEGEDYSLDEAGILWLPGQGPAEGEGYGAEYLYAPRLVALGDDESASRLDPRGVFMPRLMTLTEVRV